MEMMTIRMPKKILVVITIRMPKKIFVVLMKTKSLVMVRLHLEWVVVPSHRFAPVGRVTELQ